MAALERRRIGRPFGDFQDPNLTSVHRKIEDSFDVRHPAIIAANRPIVQRAFAKQFPGDLGGKVFDNMVREGSFDFDSDMHPDNFLAFQILRERIMLKAKEQIKTTGEQPIELFNAATDRSDKNEQTKNRRSLGEVPLANTA